MLYQLSYMGCSSSSRSSASALRGIAERQTGFTFCQRVKSPKAASNLQFERPWDRLVPAKSVRNANRAHRVSKKFLGIFPSQGCRYIAPFSRNVFGAEEFNSAEDSLPPERSNI